MHRAFRSITFALLLVPALCAAQPAAPSSEVLKHEFSEYTVYIALTPLQGAEKSRRVLMEVWRRQDGQCAMYPSVVELTAAGIQFPSGRAWEIGEAEEGVRIQFPGGRAVTYRPARQDPQQLCIGSQGT
jgi:hypothetical protein